ncbi:hypothetical protein [Paenibacillus sp. NPDC093718]|uniref:hypothetical protein n=1 Tax=Paenibacillus sp. NPDC093718 TaxID=3390601 RepID=UPI003D036572
MARQDNKLTNAFEDFNINDTNTEADPKQEDGIYRDTPEDVDGNPLVSDNMDNDHVSGQQSSNNSSITYHETSNSNTGDESEEEDEYETLESLTKKIQDALAGRENRLTMEDTHERTTFLFDKKLKKRLNKLAHNKRGFKTHFINNAISLLLDQFENQNKK